MGCNHQHPLLTTHKRSPPLQNQGLLHSIDLDTLNSAVRFNPPLIEGDGMGIEILG
ncbi:hypothetical protein PanWU01x14_293180 [Parasponia andersonii]|uniref:Uncharacterized protein n=1 Tax=Parasponia andersonii TaxID=3476 RepID=A0A2P5AWV1_PARAD|nr:hypothetical protein PanWU01x14_293180 [Parasponia andersonii]